MIFMWAKQEKTSILHIQKDADQLCSNCEADQHLCFHYMDSRSKISYQPASVTVQVDLCRTWSETTLFVFSWCDSCELLAWTAAHSLIWILDCSLMSSCSKLTILLVNNSSKFQMAILQLHCYFLLKNMWDVFSTKHKNEFAFEVEI